MRRALSSLSSVATRRGTQGAQLLLNTSTPSNTSNTSSTSSTAHRCCLATHLHFTTSPGPPPPSLEVPEPSTTPRAPVFYDMRQSNNCARVRIWLALKAAALPPPPPPSPPLLLLLLLLFSFFSSSSSFSSSCSSSASSSASSAFSSSPPPSPPTPCTSPLYVHLNVLNGLPPGAVVTRTVTPPDLHSPEYTAVNPLQKVPALVDAQGGCLFEASVILNYLEDKFAGVGSVGLGSAATFRPTAAPESPEARAAVELLVRVHDLYIASANCTQPGFTHTQGAMYLAPHATKFTPTSRTIDRPTRAAKIAEIWKHLSWLEEQLEKQHQRGDG
eukprot:CAMPEP_0197578634 /NCGR_PEP_ID=MMETSP1326-20131121/2751_1 /TAXON_ID=1155430 /ORGANISM="Genus nov. species nov., Strain RCC2288" /LENGTH=329 /DNA_ID=CAMNT_0043141825 /DNA_START=189 /DNA_END=1175 /DNA_ORIENTATION=-